MLATEDAVIAFDDFRAEHTPGTAGAVWEEVVNGGLHLLALSSTKLYGSWGNVDDARERLLADLRRQDRWKFDEHDIAGTRAVRIYQQPPTRVQRLTGWGYRTVVRRLLERRV